ALADCLHTLIASPNASEGAGVAKLRAEFIALYEEVARDYSTYPYGDSTLGDFAQRALRRHRDLAPGQPAPQTVGTDTDGAKFNLADYRGKTVLLVFCGHWCPPCRQLYPYERELHARFKDRPFAIVGVNSDTDLEKFRQARAREKLTW